MWYTANRISLSKEIPALKNLLSEDLGSCVWDTCRLLHVHSPSSLSLASLCVCVCVHACVQVFVCACVCLKPSYAKIVFRDKLPYRFPVGNTFVLTSSSLVEWRRQTSSLLSFLADMETQSLPLKCSRHHMYMADLLCRFFLVCRRSFISGLITCCIVVLYCHSINC